MSSAIILTHPAFEREKVENPVFRGKKRGCVNFRIARREILAARARRASCHLGGASESISIPPKQPASTELRQFQELYESANDERAEYMRRVLETVITSEIYHRTGIW